MTCQFRIEPRELIDHSTRTEPFRGSFSPGITQSFSKGWFVEQFSRFCRQCRPIPNGNQEAGLAIVNNFGKFRGRPAHHGLARGHRFQGFFNPSLSLSNHDRVRKLNRMCAIRYAPGEVNAKVIESECPAKMFQSKCISSRAKNNQLQIGIVVPKHVEGNNGILQPRPTLSSTSIQEQLSRGGDLQLFPKPSAIRLLRASGSCGADQR